MSLFLETCIGPAKISGNDAIHFRFWKAVLTASDLAVPVYAKRMIEWFDWGWKNMAFNDQVNKPSHHVPILQIHNCLM